MVEISCPADCVYLTSAREHPPAVVQRQQQQDWVVLLPVIQGLSEPQARLFFLGASVVVRFKPDDLQRVVDADVAEAAAALAATYETAQRGVIYEHRATSPVAQRLGAELKAVYAQVGEKGGSRFERDAAAALRAIETGARRKEKSAAETAYYDLLRRFVAPRPGATDTREEPDVAPPSIIIPGSA